ncbi:hypothetical protein WMY93_000640 [Mugilogobius chulae]|uniref:IGFBP N-terminal domain-containing protein n=1 Tax=Mugilogobius chulae TaxID=88201 RepID=A0AAW0Q307_9GOBI
MFTLLVLHVASSHGRTSRPITGLVVVVHAPAPSREELKTDGQTNRFVVGCPSRCDKSMCPRIAADCSTGQTLDACGCCPVCASGEGESCGGSGKLGDPVCGEGLECSVPGRRALLRHATEPVCGSDGVSYRNICELKKVSLRAQKLQQPPVLFIQRGACGKGQCGQCLWVTDKWHHGPFPNILKRRNRVEWPSASSDRLSLASNSELPFSRAARNDTNKNTTITGIFCLFSRPEYHRQFPSAQPFPVTQIGLEESPSSMYSMVGQHTAPAPGPAPIQRQEHTDPAPPSIQQPESLYATVQKPQRTQR